MAFSVSILARDIALRVFLSCFLAGTVFRGGRQYSENPLVLGVQLEDTTLFAPTYDLESDALMGLNTHVIRLFHDSGKFPLMSNLKVECVFPDSTHIRT